MVTTKLCGAEVFDAINKDPGTYKTPLSIGDSVHVTLPLSIEDSVLRI